MIDQAQGLRVLTGSRAGAPEFARDSRKAGPYVVAVTSGKGGVGKTTVAANMAVALAAEGRTVTLLDADLGLSNIDVLLGLNSQLHLGHVLSGEHEIDDIVVEGPHGVKVVTAGSGLRQMADLEARDRRAIVDRVISLARDSDFLIIDTSPGIGSRVLDFVCAANEAIVVTTGDPSSMADSYAAIKNIRRRAGGVRIELLVNMARTDKEGQRVAASIDTISQRFLGTGLDGWWRISPDQHVERAAGKQQSFAAKYPSSPASVSLRKACSALAQRADEWKMAGQRLANAS